MNSRSYTNFVSEDGSVPAYTMAPHSENLKMMRVVVREDFSKSRCDALIADIKLALQILNEIDERRLAEYQM
jgi:glutamate decarboxylase